MKFLVASASLQKVVQRISPRFRFHFTKPKASFSNTAYRQSLASTISLQTLASIQTLPEVSNAISLNNESTLDGLDRAAQVFQQFNPNGEEYRAVKMLQAQGYMQLFSYPKAMEVLDSLLKLDLTPDELFQCNLATTRLFWEQGLWEEATIVANELCDVAPQMEDNVNVPLRQGTALNALALCRLAAANAKDVDMVQLRKRKRKQAGDGDIDEDVESQLTEADIAQDLLKMASKALFKGYKDGKGSTSSHISHNRRLGLYCAASYCNQGAAELMTILMKSACVKRSLPIDSAMNAWRDALNLLDEMQQDESKLSEKESIFLKSTRARVYCNMAWALLFSSSYIDSTLDKGDKGAPVEEASIKLASEYAGLALKLSDDIENADGSLGRTLCLVASCYERAGSAVNAEGLFQSAMDVLKPSPNLSKTIDARSAFVNYSKLCRNWENREADASKYEKLALEMDDSLAEQWRGASSLYSGFRIFGCTDL